ncbi:MAG: hypothetical protein M1587_06800 [Thaumarchaeota archaeon]|nr:hypothetical protein [Nitrososphaerota archaeon]MDG6905495.1 hypothetical protein [Nitrososphaerota archaeon]
MAFDDPIVFVLLLFEIAIPLLAIYGLYKLVRFVNKVNRFIDQQEPERKNK